MCLYRRNKAWLTGRTMRMKGRLSRSSLLIDTTARLPDFFRQRYHEMRGTNSDTILLYSHSSVQSKSRKYTANIRPLDSFLVSGS